MFELSVPYKISTPRKRLDKNYTKNISQVFIRIVSTGKKNKRRLLYFPQPCREQYISSNPTQFWYFIRNKKGKSRILGVMRIDDCVYKNDKLEYGVLIWYPYISQIERKQRKILKYLYFKITAVFPERGFDYSIILTFRRRNSKYTTKGQK
nr:unnamed protein product [Callosobruchus chinensis]